jgi:hypothetical protein
MLRKKLIENFEKGLKVKQNFVNEQSSGFFNLTNGELPNETPMIPSKMNNFN